MGFVGFLCILASGSLLYFLVCGPFLHLQKVHHSSSASIIVSPSLQISLCLLLIRMPVITFRAYLDRLGYPPYFKILNLFTTTKFFFCHIRSYSQVPEIRTYISRYLGAIIQPTTQLKLIMFKLQHITFPPKPGRGPSVERVVSVSPCKGQNLGDIFDIPFSALSYPVCLPSPGNFISWIFFKSFFFIIF